MGLKRRFQGVIFGVWRKENIGKARHLGKIDLMNLG